MSKDWRAQERKVARDIGGTLNAGSGAFDRKGDVRGTRGGMLVESKWTGKKQFTVKADVLEKIVREAIIDGRTPVLHLDLNGREYAIVEWDDWLAISG